MTVLLEFEIKRQRKLLKVNIALSLKILVQMNMETSVLKKYSNSGKYQEHKKMLEEKYIQTKTINSLHVRFRRTLDESNCS